MLLIRLEVIAKSSTDEEYADNLSVLTQSSEWQEDPALQQWLAKKWFPHYKVSLRLKYSKPSIDLSFNNLWCKKNGDNLMINAMLTFYYSYIMLRVPKLTPLCFKTKY